MKKLTFKIKVVLSELKGVTVMATTTQSSHHDIDNTKMDASVYGFIFSLISLLLLLCSVLPQAH